MTNKCWNLPNQEDETSWKSNLQVHNYQIVETLHFYIRDGLHVHTHNLSQASTISIYLNHRQGKHMKTIATNSSQLGITPNQSWSFHQTFSTFQHLHQQTLVGAYSKLVLLKLSTLKLFFFLRVYKPYPCCITQVHIKTNLVITS